MLNGHMSFASVAVGRHVQGFVIVSELEAVLKFMSRQDCTVGITEVDCGPHSSFAGSSSSVFVVMHTLSEPDITFSTKFIEFPYGLFLIIRARATFVSEGFGPKPIHCM